MRSGYILLLLFISSFGLPSDLKAQKKIVEKESKQPQLVIGIVVDQMRSDYIYRFWNKLGNNGFKRLMREGFDCRNTQYNYMPTYTGPGHASIYTGTTPSMHGIIGNAWFMPELNRTVNCVWDPGAGSVGGNELSGHASPHRLITTTVGDELNLFTNFKSRVIGVSLKDRGAILPAGKSGMAYWFDNVSANFVSSTWYFPKENPVLPKWIFDFNALHLPDAYLSSTWEPLYDISSYTESTNDNTPYESILDTTPGARPVFNYDLNRIRSMDSDLLRKTPFGNKLITEFALAAIEGENLGSDSYCDMLLVSYSATDYVGHEFATHAVETEDTYLRLDLEIERILNYIDKKFGRDNVLLFLTADHGAMPNPVFLNDHKIAAGFIDNNTITDSIRGFLKRNYQVDLLQYFINDQVWLNDSIHDAMKLDKGLVSETLCKYLMQQSNVADVLSRSLIEKEEFVIGTRAMVQRGFNYKRSGDIAVVYDPGYIESYGSFPERGTTHGSSYRYDTQVPLLWYGWKIKSGNTVRQINITDIAPTISALLNICQPSGCSGEPIEEIFR